MTFQFAHFSKFCAQNADLVTKCILKILVSCRASADVIKNSSKTVNSYRFSVLHLVSTSQ